MFQYRRSFHDEPDSLCVETDGTGEDLVLVQEPQVLREKLQLEWWVAMPHAVASNHQNDHFYSGSISHWLTNLGLHGR